MEVRHATFVFCLFLVAIGAPTSALAQGGTMTFGEDDAEQVEEEPDEEASSGEESEGMTFAGEEDSESEGAEDKPLVGVVAVPSDAIDETNRQRIRTDLSETLDRVEDIQIQSGSAVYEALKKRRVASCVREPLCLGQVGGDAGVDRIVLARVQQKEDGFQVNVDYFNVSDRLFIRYETADELMSREKVVSSVEPLVERLFDLSTPDRSGPEYADGDNKKAMRIVSFVAGGTALATLGIGLVFGAQANAAEKDLNSHEKNAEGVYTGPSFTQTTARSDLQSAKSKARLANGFFIASGGLAVVGGVLFIVQASSGDNPDERKTSSLPQRIDVAPAVGRRGAGLRAAFSF